MLFCVHWFTLVMPPAVIYKETILRFSYKPFFESPEFEIGFVYETYTSVYVCLSLCSSGEKTV